MTASTKRGRILRFTAEAGAIFLGVSLGFIADDYREDLNERRLERESLAQLLQDLELDSADVEPMLAQTRWLAEASRWITNSKASGGVPYDSLAVVLDSINQTSVFTYEASSAAYSGLKSTGRLDLVRDPDLKRAIIHYFEDRQPAVGVINAAWQDANSRWLDASASHLDVAYTGPDQEWPNFRLNDPATFLGDRVLMFRLGELSGSSLNMNRYATEILELNRDLASRVEAYLERG